MIIYSNDSLQGKHYPYYLLRYYEIRKDKVSLVPLSCNKVTISAGAAVCNVKRARILLLRVTPLL